MKMPLLDRAFYLLDSARSPQDFTLILDLRDTPAVDQLCAGGRSAMNRFPLSACRVAGREWVWRGNECFRLEDKTSIERFIDEPFDLRREPPVKQMLQNGRLATRFHHAAADGLSAALWVGHQLNVAYGSAPAQSERRHFDGLRLRESVTSVRRSRYAFDGASDSLRTTNSTRSGSRRWSTICFPSIRRAHGFTYHDLLLTCTLEVLRTWHDSINAKIGLWVPMNARRESREGFGNGTSRVRVYANYDRNASLLEKCRAVREQVAWTTAHGEWVVPDLPWLARLPNTIVRPLLRNYLKLPHVDMATAVFTHAATSLANAEAFKHVERIECVGLLHPRQNLAINAATHSGHTSLTLTYDPALLTTGELNQLTQLFSQQIAQARTELA